MYHKTKTGESIPIPAMLDSHLLNTIKILCEKVKESKLNITVPEYAKSFYPSTEDLTIRREASQKKATESLLPYIFWAMLRPGIKEEVVTLLWDAYDIVEGSSTPF